MMKYRKGYKYQLAETYTIKTDMTGFNIEVEFIRLYADGTLIILSGYAWDGPSGPGIDSKNFMEGSLVHDALYQLLRMGLLPAKYREGADKLLHKICRSKGMSKIRAWWVLRGLRFFAAQAADPKNKKIIYTIP